MESSVFFGGSVVAAVVAGMIALFAPCCISFMLPAYFASSFQNRLRQVAMTFVFAAGVATMILPIALGASLLRQLMASQHMTLYILGGIFLLALAIYLFLGGEIHLPMPGQRTGGTTGIASVYTLGLFSGITSSCCAPVLASVIALSSVAPSFSVALGLGLAYVFGMVAPLFVISYLWERYDWRSSRLFKHKSYTWHIGKLQRRLSRTNLASAILLFVLGIAMIWVGFTSPAMPKLSGWQATFSVALQHYGQIITRTLIWIPNWLAGVIVFLLIALPGYYVYRQWDNSREEDEVEDEDEDADEIEDEAEGHEENNTVEANEEREESEHSETISTEIDKAERKETVH